MARGLELVRDLHRERYFGARCDEHDLARSRGTAQTITAFRAKIFRDVMAQRRKVLAGQREQRRRSEEHTSELQSLMRISYAVFCLKKKNTKKEDSRPKPLTTKTK